MENFKVGIIGAGHIARKMAHTLRDMKGVEPYAVASRNYENAQGFAYEWGFTRAYGSYDELVNDPNVQLIYIATAHSHHFEQAKMCLEKGKPVLCEKAFTANAREAETLIRISQEKQVFLTEAIWTRYMPFSKTLRELVDSGIIGRAMMLTANIGYPISDKERIAKPELCGGALLDIGVYPINFALMLFGNEITGITSACVRGETGVDLQNSITFVYRNHRMAVLQMTAFCANDRQGIISGDKGYIIVDNINNPQQAIVYSVNHEEVARYYCPLQITGFEYQVQASIEAIRQGKIETSDMPHAETLRVMRLLDDLRYEWGIHFPSDDRFI
jgi:predicted dehydrogenase